MKYSEEDLREAVAQSQSFADVCPNCHSQTTTYKNY